MKVIADSKIPYLQGVFEPFVDIEYIRGSEITRKKLSDADALIVRTRTKCDAELLEGTPVKFIATATIGYDHIDTSYCKSKGITWTNAPGCNSGSVMQYLTFALLHYAKSNSIDLTKRVLGVVGVGNVGKKIVRLAELLDMQVVLNDPPRQRIEGPCGFVSLQGILREADIISFHVPLITEGIDKTYHLVDESFLNKLNKGTLLINTSRGEVINTHVLKKFLEKQLRENVILDVWENEPLIDTELLNRIFYATPHIAGYSADGKANGTMMSVQALSKFFKLGIDDWQPEEIPQPEQKLIYCDGTGKSFQEVLTEIVFKTYDFKQDENKLRQNPSNFEIIRESYPVRREFRAFTVEAVNIDQKNKIKLQQLGFNFAR